MSRPLLNCMLLAALREDRRGKHTGRERLPQEYVCIKVDEWLLLHAVGDEFAESPPTGVDMAELIKLGGDVGKGQAEGIDEERFAGAVCNQHGLRKMLASESQRKPPGQQVMEMAGPGTASLRTKRLAPE